MKNKKNQSIKFTGKNIGEICKFVGKDNIVLASTLPFITVLTDNAKLRINLDDYLFKDESGEIFKIENESDAE